LGEEVGMDMDREAGLPKLVPDTGAFVTALRLAKGVVRKVYPELWRVDLEAEDGGIIHKAVVMGPHLPPVHKDLEQPSHVYFMHANGHAADAVCWPLTFRRFLDPERDLTKEQGKNPRSQKERGDLADSEGEDDEPPQHFYHTHVYAQRLGDITINVTDDNTWVIKSESGDQIRLNQERREIDLLAPTIRLGSMEHTRIEYVRGERVHIVMPEILLGTPESDERLVLGDAWRSFFNLFVALFNSHRHMQVQPGGGLSGFPFQRQNDMSEELLSDISKTQKSFPDEEYS
jgi:hypothetical protein